MIREVILLGEMELEVRLDVFQEFYLLLCMVLLSKNWT